MLFINNLLTQALRTNSSQLLRVLLPATIVFFIGVYDDFRGTNAPVKFTAQGLAGLLFCVMSGRIEALSVPLVGSVELHPVLGYALTLLWTIGISNAFNLIDGMDGLATGTALFAAMVVMLVSLMLGHPVVTVFAVVLCGSLIGFLPYNFNPASIFLGDSGSLFIGFTLAALSVQGTQKASTAVAVAIPLIAFGVPVADTGFSNMRRFIGGKPIFQGDREHIHHMLLARGWSRRVTLAFYGACALFGLLALFLVNDRGMQRTGLVLSVVGAVIMLAILRLRCHEVDEVKAAMRRRFSEHRLRVANNIRARRASWVKSKATTLSEIFDAIQELLELGDFVYATMQLGQNSNGNRHGNGNGDGNVHGNRNGHCAVREKKASLMQETESHNGIRWIWQRRNVEADKITGSGRFWTLRLPLTTESAEWGYLNLYREFGSGALLLDINYLCDFFQGERAKAVERVVGRSQPEREHEWPSAQPAETVRNQVDSENIVAI